MNLQMTDVKEMLQSIDNTLKRIEKILLEDQQNKKSTIGGTFPSSVEEKCYRNITFP